MPQVRDPKTGRYTSGGGSSVGGAAGTNPRIQKAAAVGAGATAGGGSVATASTKPKVSASKVEVDSGRYAYTHGKSPSGRGTWYFSIGQETPFFYGKFSDAKKQAQQYAAERGITRISVET